ncbi:efflux RND transporter permease subunit [Phenylobacterium sp.]|uniref:efflux RND transporter permease subunit n=1 Tax=Phenylobacterium sp. TaxID=1871053 RepID=UPI002F3E4412
MNAIVRIALSRPYTFVVMAVLIMIFGTMAALRTPTDIFPEIRVPVIGVAFNFAGLSPGEMSNRIVTQFERFLTTTVNDVEHTESQSVNGIGIVKIFFQPGVDIRTATAQVTSTAQSSIKQMPAGVTPPLVLNYSAATVPILQLADSDKTLSEQKLFDLSQVVIRPVLTTVPGAATPYPYGGQLRQIQIDLDPQALQSKGVSANDVTTALANQNQILPVGFVKIGSYQYNVRLNDAAETIEDLNSLPIKTVNGATIFIRDVGQVRDGAPPQTNIVHVDGGRAVLSTILKTGSASTLAVVQGVKDKLPGLAEQLPSTFKITALNDQSLFVKGAISSVIKEGAIAAALTSLMILLFLGSWRSTVIIAVSIPLAVLAAIAALSVSGQTLNIMTLGGLALAVGILVDDATVTIENINWHLEQGKDVRTAILDGANQIVTPAFVSLLCICIVFVPMFLLKGVAGFLFVPMAMSVVYAMIASFVLSRTLVPTMAMYLLRPHAQEVAASHGSRNPLARFQRRFEEGFAGVRSVYAGLLERAMGARRPFLIGFLAVVVLSFGLAPFLGSNFFPSVDAGQMTLHVRAPVGTRLEDTSLEFRRIENTIRQVIPADEITSIVDNIGIPNSSINMVYSNSGVIGPEDGDIYVSLKPHHHPTPGYMKRLREVLPREYPGTSFAFLPADIVSQILNFGAPAPIDLQISGPNAAANRVYANNLLRKLSAVRGLADVRMQQPEGGPELRVDVDRSRIAQLGLSERDVTNSLVTTLAGSSQGAPTYWVNPKTGVSYPIVAQTPEYRLSSIAGLEGVPINGSTAQNNQALILGGLGSISRDSTPAVVSHYNASPVIDIYASTQGRDLGSVTKDINKILKDAAKDRPKGSSVDLRGQMVTMNSAFSGLFLGLGAAIVLIYLLIVVNFQSWLDPFVIITALPAALAGIVWMLFATGTTLSVPALTGAIMCMGVATANSILVVSFARERLAATGDAVRAATEAGFTRFRPVVMTALAMIIGMAPMALGLGEGGEQNAPLGRAVIGGLIFATIATLMFVPVVFSLAHGRRAHAPAAAPAPGESYA